VFTNRISNTISREENLRENNSDKNLVPEQSTLQPDNKGKKIIKNNIMLPKTITELEFPFSGGFNKNLIWQKIEKDYSSTTQISSNDEASGRSMITYSFYFSVLSIYKTIVKLGLLKEDDWIRQFLQSFDFWKLVKKMAFGHVYHPIHF